MPEVEAIPVHISARSARVYGMTFIHINGLRFIAMIGSTEKSQSQVASILYKSSYDMPDPSRGSNCNPVTSANPKVIPNCCVVCHNVIREHAQRV